MNTMACIEVGTHQRFKAGERVGGDRIVSERAGHDQRVIAVLSDGLGSGIKANVLATLTATMALKYVCSEMNIRKAAEVIMATLPVCSQRRIGYSTFTIVDIRSDGQIRIVEHDNPPTLLLRGAKPETVDRRAFEIETGNLGRRRLTYSRFRAEQGVRLVIYSDGLSQPALAWGGSCVSSAASSPRRLRPGGRRHRHTV